MFPRAPSKANTVETKPEKGALQNEPLYGGHVEDCFLDLRSLLSQQLRNRLNPQHTLELRKVLTPLWFMFCRLRAHSEISLPETTTKLHGNWPALCSESHSELLLLGSLQELLQSVLSRLLKPMYLARELGRAPLSLPSGSFESYTLSHWKKESTTQKSITMSCASFSTSTT